MKKYQTIFQLGVFLLLCPFPTAHSADTLNEMLEHIHTERMMNDIESLSHVQFEGRQAGTVGGQQAANFVRNRFERLRLIPNGHVENRGTKRTWVQQQSLSAPRLHGSTVVEFTPSHNGQIQTPSKSTFGTDFLPILDSPSVNMTAPIVFVGYGIDDPARGINDYEGIDVHNRIVMFFRGKPTTYSQWVTHEEKTRTAHQHGAVGFITLTGPILNRYEARRGIGRIPLAMYSSTPDERPLPGVWLDGAFGEQLFASQEHSLKEIQAQLNEGKNLSKKLHAVSTLQWTNTPTTGKLINVVGMISGKNSMLSHEIILIGAHRDHFGKQAGLLFAGADDNASGTAVLLEMARLFSTIKEGPARTIVLVSFDGEERGLLGSKLYVQQPRHPLHKTVAMINVDHVGVGNGKLTVGLTRFPKSIGQQAAARTSLKETEKTPPHQGVQPPTDPM